MCIRDRLNGCMGRGRSSRRSCIAMPLMEAAMPLDNQDLDHLLARLASAARSGNRAKRRLARKLATMSPQQLQHVDPDIFARLGPQGLKLFAAASRNFKSVAAAPQPIKVRGSESSQNRPVSYTHLLLKPITHRNLQFTHC